MPMRDTASATRTMTTTQALGTAQATVVQATPFDLGSAALYAVPVTFHTYYPSNPTGSGQSIACNVEECDTVGGTYTPLGSLHVADAVATGFPKEYHQPMVPRKRFCRLSWVIAGTTPGYGTATAWLSAQSEEKRSWP